jgi:hypothetical protein
MSMPILKEPPVTLREAVVPYLMAALNMLAPTLAAGYDHTAQLRLVQSVAVGLILLGIPCSIWFRMRRYNRYLLNILTMVPLLTLTWALTRTHPGLQIDWNNVWGSMMSHEVMDQLAGMLQVFVLLSAGRAFLLVITRDMVQTPLPGIIIFLLVAVLNRNTRQMDTTDLFTLACLLVFLATSLFIFSQDHTQTWFTISTPLRVQRRMVLWMVGFVILFFPLSLFLGSRLEKFNMYALASARRMRSPRMNWNFGRGGELGLGMQDSVTLGGSDWPSGSGQTIMRVRLAREAPQYLLWREATYTKYERGQWQRTLDVARNRPHWRSGSNGEQLLDLSRGYHIDVVPNRADTLVVLDPQGELSDPGIVQAIKEKAITLKVDPVTHAVRPDNKVAVLQQFSLRARFIGGGPAPVPVAYQLAHVAAADVRFRSAFVRTDGALMIANTSSDNPLNAYDAVSIVKPLPTLMKLKQAVTLPYRYDALQMPGGPGGDFATKVRAKAREILKADGLTEKGDPFEIVRHFEMYLGSHYQYTLKPAAPRSGVDPVLDFLNAQKRGYCVYFASALVMMCRSIGLPARFVVGYGTGEQMENAPEAERRDSIVYEVKGKDAHAWAEIFLPHYGWYTSDPTAGSQLAPTVWGTLWDAVTGAATAIKNGLTTFFTLLKTDPRVRAYAEIAFALLLLGVAGIVYWRQERPPAYPKRTLNEAEARACIIAGYARVLRWLDLWGVMKPDGLTAQEFDRLFWDVSPTMGEPVRALTGLYLRAKYDAAPLSDADARAAVAAMQALWELARTEKRTLLKREMDL